MREREREREREKERRVTYHLVHSLWAQTRSDSIRDGCNSTKNILKRYSETGGFNLGENRKTVERRENERGAGREGERKALNPYHDDIPLAAIMLLDRTSAGFSFSLNARVLGAAASGIVLTNSSVLGERTSFSFFEKTKHAQTPPTTHNHTKPRNNHLFIY
jgi:hypothetical protein